MKIKLSSKKVIITGIIFLFLGLFFIESKTNILTTALRGNDPTAEIRKVTIESSNYPEAGSWSIDKSAEWIGINQARVVFDVSTKLKTVEGNYKDVILIMDISGSMSGEKLEKAKTDAIELSNYLLSDSHNKVALISFDSTSTVVSSFTNNLTTITDAINNLADANNTNYNAGLLNVFEVMEGYEKKEDTDLITLFLTDGYPNEDTPNQKGTYAALKDKYPYMAINGIQYEMGSAIIQDIVDITDNQWIASMDTLNNVLFEAAIDPLTYESFIVEDYIDSDYYTLDSINDIKVSMGTISLDNTGSNQKVVWTIENSLVTGGNATMTIDLSLKSAYHETEGLYPTNDSETIKTKLPGEEEITTNSDKTPSLKNAYKVIYDANSPDVTCTLPTYSEETHFIYQTVEKKDEELTCSGYLFKGWEIDESDDEDISHLNSDYFMMPSHDVTIRATWTTLGISKTMDGTVHEKATLYKVLENAAKEGTYAKEYTGAHQDSISGAGDKKIYYWYGSNDTKGTAILDKNNVIFANHCWQMIRTTDTGGVKMIYNGEPENNQCLNTRSNHIGTVGTQGSTKNLNGDYIYGTSYTYDETNSTFTLTGTKTTVRWSDSTYKTLFGKYTCASATDSCTTLYQVNGYSNSTTAYTTSYTVGNTHYSQIGTTPFNANDRSPAMVGYMYNDVYNYKTYATTATQKLTTTNTILTINSSSNSMAATYKYSKTINFTGSTYELVDPILGSDIPETDYSEYYTFRSATTVSGTRPYYIVGLNSGTSYYYIQLSVTKQKSDFDMMIGDSIIDNGDDTYTINNPTRVSVDDWYSNYANYVNKYTCGDTTVTCTSPRYSTATTRTDYTYLNAGEKILIAKGRNGLNLTDTLIVRKDELVINSSNYSDYKYTCNDTSSTCTEANLRMITAYSTTGYTYVKNHYWGSSVTWDGTNYTLVDQIEIENYNNTTNLSTHHYMCVDNGLKTCSTVAYVYYYTSSGSMYYVILENGKEIEDALNEMLYNDDVNEYNSTIKGNIDAWYEMNMLPYDEYLEDTIFCNDRSIPTTGSNTLSQSGWNPNGGSLSTYIYFKEYNATKDLSCTNETDKFSVGNNKAKLTYKVGLMSNPEMNLLNNSNIRKTGQNYWLASPRYWSSSDAYARLVFPLGALEFLDVNFAFGARPAVSLAPLTEYSEGNGSMARPFIVN